MAGHRHYLQTPIQRLTNKATTTTMNPPTAIASASKSHRVYGLNSRAWRDARVARACHSNENIVRAVLTAVSEDAGGFGSVGFHRVSALRVKLCGLCWY